MLLPVLLSSLIAPHSIQQDSPILTIVRPSALDPTLDKSWAAADERRWSPLPQDAPVQYLAQIVFRDRWKIAEWLELKEKGLTLDADDVVGEEEEEEGGGDEEHSPGLEKGQINGHEVAWTEAQESIHFDRNANTVMAAYGYAVWGKYYFQESWLEKSEEIARLWAVSPDQPTYFYTPNQTYKPSTDTAGPSMSAFWGLKRLEVEPESIDETMLAKLLVVAEQPIQSVETALFQSTLAQSSLCPAELKTKLETKLNNFVWPKVETVKTQDLPYLTWALASEYNRNQSAAFRSVLLQSAIRLAKLQYTEDDPNHPSHPTFGAIKIEPNVTVSNDNPNAALALCEAGDALKNAQLLQRGVAAMRSSLGMFRTGFSDRFGPSQPYISTLLAMHSYGVNGTDQYEKWHNFESDEGKIMAAAAYLMSRYGAMYELLPGEWVGIDGIRVENKPVDILYNLTRPFTKLLPYRQQVNAKHERSELVSLGRRPTITDIELVAATPEPTVRVYTGASVTGSQVFAGQNPLTMVLSGKNNQVTLAPDEQGFSAPCKPNIFDSSVSAILKYEGQMIAKSANLFVTPPLGANATAPRGWTRTGMLNILPVPRKANDWISTQITSSTPKPEYIGTIESPAFFGTNRLISSTVKGTDLCKFQLLDDESNAVLIDFEATTGEETKIEWDTALYGNRRIRLRLLDLSKTGYIDVKDVKLSANVIPVRK